jgi:hypothetical protein
LRKFPKFHSVTACSAHSAQAVFSKSSSSVYEVSHRSC